MRPSATSLFLCDFRFFTLTLFLKIFFSCSEQLNLTYAQYHSFWTGIAEILVGTSLILTTSGVLGEQFNNPTIPAGLMYLLTLIVTPANIYMYTHNPVVPRIPPLPYPYGHVGRGVLQMALLAVFYKLTIHSMM